MVKVENVISMPITDLWYTGHWLVDTGHCSTSDTRAGRGTEGYSSPSHWCLELCTQVTSNFVMVTDEPTDFVEAIGSQIAIFNPN